MDHDLKNELIESYNTNARLREKAEMETWKLDEMNWFISFFQSTENLKLLDIGAGAGQQSEYLKSRGFDVHCMDSSIEMVNCCRNKNLTASVMDFYSITFEEGSFDAIWSMNALLHVPKNSLPTVLKNIGHVLKPEGLFYLGVYGGYDSEGVWEEDPYKPNRFFSFFTHEDIQREVGKYFEIVQFKVVEMPGMTPDFHSMILRKLG